MLYLVSLVIPVSVLFSLMASGPLTYTALFVAFFILPGVELLLPTRSYSPVYLGMPPKFFDVILVLQVPIQLGLLYLFLETTASTANSLNENIGYTLSMGLACGVLGINVGHELGHRQSLWEQWLARILLSTSLYTQFMVEHNYGHHKDVATPHDPSTSRKNESVYKFVVRSACMAFLSSLQIHQRLFSKKAFHKSPLIQGFLCNALLIAIIYYFYGLGGIGFYLGASAFGIFLLESVNYIEHYGLLRKKLKTKDAFEPVKAIHSWNSNHPISRFVLFELSRHSDHHHKAYKKFYELQSIENAPQMPTGYPGMMLLAMFPPLWYKVMNKKVEELTC